MNKEEPLARAQSPLILGDLEMEVLEQFWTLGSGEVRGVHFALGGDRENHPNTVQSALERLFRKCILEREKQSPAYIYSPRLNREELVATCPSPTATPLAGTLSREAMRFRLGAHVR